VTSGTRVHLYSVRTRKLVKTITRFYDDARSGEVRRDGKVLVAGDDSGRIQVFDVSSRAILRTWTAHKQPVWATKFSPTELTSVVSASDDKTVRLWDLTSNEPLKTFVGHQDYVRSVRFMPGSMSNIIISGSYDSTVRLWDPRMQGNSSVRTFKHSAAIEDVLPLSSGATVCASSGEYISVLDMIAAQPLRLLKNHQKTVTSLSEASGGRRVVSGGLDGHVKVFETTGWNVVATMKYSSPILAVKVISSGSGEDAADRHLVVGMDSGVLSIRSRLSGIEAAKKKAREKEMEALLAGTIDLHDREIKKKARDLTKKRRLDVLGAGAEHTIEDEQAMKQPKESPWARKLQFHQYSEALDAALDTSSGNFNDLNILTVLRDLRHRNAMQEALKDRDENTILPIMRWISNRIMDPKLADVCVEVAFQLMELYGHYVEHSEVLREQFQTLHRRTRIYVEKAQYAIQLLGALETVMDAA
jgi:U3 small nucleolar RNA-associated protein 15